MARQQRVDWGDGEEHPHLDNGHAQADDWARVSQDNGIAGEGNGRLCPSNGVENGMDSGCDGGHLLMRSSANGDVIEGEDLEDVDGSLERGGGRGEEGHMSQLKVPMSLYSSNILGLSQETDSDAESIR